MSNDVRHVRVVGAGRAGGALALALRRAGVGVDGPWGRDRHLAGAAHGVDVLVVAVPDSAIAAVAAAVEPVASTVVAHVSGAARLDVLAPHARRASLHPLMTLPDAERGADRLRGAWFAVAGSDDAAAGAVEGLAAALGGRALRVDDDRRAAYHAAATIAANHVVALLGQVERVAATAGVPLAAYLAMVHAAVDNVEALGPAGALTGPVARGDWATVARHLAAVDPTERDGYLAGAALADRLARPGPAGADHRARVLDALRRAGAAGRPGEESAPWRS